MTNTVSFADQTIYPWCDVPQSGRWCWVADVNAKEKLRVMPRSLMSPADKSNASLAKAYACMQSELNKAQRSDLMQTNTRDALLKLRDVVEKRYESYCETYCIFARIWEVFLSIFPSRLSTWNEHRRLLTAIDQSLGRIARPHECGQPSFDGNGIPLITPILKRIESMKNKLEKSRGTLNVPCRLVSSIKVTFPNGRSFVQNAANPNNPSLFDKSYNHASDDPKKFFSDMAAAVKDFPTQVTGVPESGKFAIDIEMAAFSTNPQAAGKKDTVDIYMLSETQDLVLPQTLSSSHEVSGFGPDSYEGYSLNVYKPENFAQDFKHLKLPQQLFDAQGNFA